MTSDQVSLISTLVNLGLGSVKLFFGYLIGSVALIADGIHSGLDVFSSFITFLGLKKAKKPEDKKHPYGYWKVESLTGLVVALLLGISGAFIIYEAINRFLGEGIVKLSWSAIVVVIGSIIITEILARLKFYVGNKNKSLCLIADAQHSRADAFSSVGVLIGLVLVRYFNLADAIIALLIGLYILYEAIQLGREIADSLLDVSNPEIEKQIKKICQEENINIADLKTRKIGPYNSAQLQIKLPPDLKIAQAQKITQSLEKNLLNKIEDLKQLIISAKAYKLSLTSTSSWFGRRMHYNRGFEQIGPPKKGQRWIIPLEGDHIASRFGAKKYLIQDKKDNQIIQEKIINNPYAKGRGSGFFGARFAKAVKADKVILKRIGPGAKENLSRFGIDVVQLNNKNNFKSDLINN